ncbi:MAG: hypothetical protein K6E50_10600 [Lachnospiraceae bacterium]|nr:hypothetical protein [Lachnospiraceae bacterium]
MENRIFQKALADMSFDFAAGGAIRHLHSLGYSPEEIASRLSCPVPIERIREEIAAFEAEKESNAPLYDYIKETDAAGRTSFRRVPRPGQEQDRST